MTTTLYEVKEPEIGDLCSNPNLKERMAAYLDNPVTYPAAEELEEHLLDCRSCREFFLTLLRIREEAAQNQKTRGRNFPAKDGSRTVWTKDFKQ